jgi:hypothetical protein
LQDIGLEIGSLPTVSYPLPKIPLPSSAKKSTLIICYDRDHGSNDGSGNGQLSTPF